MYNHFVCLSYIELVYLTGNNRTVILCSNFRILAVIYHMTEMRMARKWSNRPVHQNQPLKNSLPQKPDTLS